MYQTQRYLIGLSSLTLIASGTYLWYTRRHPAADASQSKMINEHTFQVCSVTPMPSLACLNCPLYSKNECRTLMLKPGQTLFAVPMTCAGCVKEVSESLYKLKGITKVEANLKDQLVSIEGTGTAALQPRAYALMARAGAFRGPSVLRQGTNDCSSTTICHR